MNRDTIERVAGELRTARAVIAELERQVLSLQSQAVVMATAISSYHRDMADPPGYLQDAVIKAAGLGALHHERDRLAAEVQALREDRAGVLLNVIQALNQNPYSLTKSECIDVVQAMRAEAIDAARGIKGDAS